LRAVAVAGPRVDARSVDRDLNDRVVHEVTSEARQRGDVARTLQQQAGVHAVAGEDKLPGVDAARLALRVNGRDRIHAPSGAVNRGRQPSRFEGHAIADGRKDRVESRALGIDRTEVALVATTARRPAADRPRGPNVWHFEDRVLAK